MKCLSWVVFSSSLFLQFVVPSFAACGCVATVVLWAVTMMVWWRRWSDHYYDVFNIFSFSFISRILLPFRFPTWINDTILLCYTTHHSTASSACCKRVYPYYTFTINTQHTTSIDIVDDWFVFRRFHYYIFTYVLSMGLGTSNVCVCVFVVVRADRVWMWAVNDSVCTEFIKFYSISINATKEDNKTEYRKEKRKKKRTQKNWRKKKQRKWNKGKRRNKEEFTNNQLTSPIIMMRTTIPLFFLFLSFDFVLWSVHSSRAHTQKMCETYVWVCESGINGTL